VSETISFYFTISLKSAGLIIERLPNLGSTPDAVASRCMCPGERILNATPHIEASNLPVVAQIDERHANRTASVLEWYDSHRANHI